MIPEKILTSLKHKKYRDRHGLFIAEGPDAVGACLAAGWPLAEIIVEPSARGRYGALLPQAGIKGVAWREIQAARMRKISDTVTGQGILAVAETAPAALPETGTMVYLDRIQDPGNAGAIIRTAAAAGFSAVVLGPESADPYNPKTVRGTAGAFTRVPCVCDGGGRLPAALKAKGFAVYVTDCRRGADFRHTDFAPNALIVMGNEGAGVSPGLEAMADACVQIPLCSGVESLNVAVAFGIIAFALKERKS